jgi:hypothetical protein
MKNSKDIGPKISEPTEKEIKETIEKIKSKHGVLLSHTDAAKFAKLIGELRWWLTVEKEGEKPGAIDDKIAKGLADIKKVKTSLDYAVAVEKKRILEEMKNILGKY